MILVETLAKARRANAQEKGYNCSKIAFFYLTSNDRTCKVYQVENIILPIKLVKIKS